MTGTAASREELLALSPTLEAVRDLILAGERFRHVMSEQSGIGSADTVVLSYLAREPGPLTPGRIGELAMMGSGSLTAVLDRLESAGLIARIPNPGDRRSVLIELQPSALRLLGYAGREMAAGLLAAFAGRDGADTQSIRDMQAMAETLSAHAEALLQGPRPSFD